MSESRIAPGYKRSQIKFNYTEVLFSIRVICVIRLIRDSDILFRRTLHNRDFVGSKVE